MARAVDQQSRELMDRILRIGDTAEVSTNKGMKTTNVAGYPLIVCWARWGGTEPNGSGNIKAFLFLPYVQSGQVSLTKVLGGTSIESPLEMVASQVPNPYNCKVGITPALNVSSLRDGDFYNFIVAIKPAAFTQSGNTMAYWDAWIMGFGIEPNDVFKQYLSLLATTKAQWTKLKASMNDDYEPEFKPDQTPDNSSHQ